MVVVECAGLAKVYAGQGERTHPVRNVSLTLNTGEVVAIVGPSGSGKTTLMRMLGCLLEPTSGEIRFCGEPMPNPRAAAGFRNRHVGFIFQDYALIEVESALFNVKVPMRYRRQDRLSASQRRGRAQELLGEVGLSGPIVRRLVKTLSGGERQRVAIARALANEAELVLADEPTGSLDGANTTQVMQLLRSLAAQNRAVLLITHDTELASSADRVLTMSYGRVVTVR
ncbi:MAG: ABC transporter ATP-binding protein [Propionibacteriaceae bacterium]|jgi:ABC-type lipoprotein export system ATPase subunit|nr:ABC transporter ATP-binding protein [Propionibacteriaceae bacterium]